MWSTGPCNSIEKWLLRQVSFWNFNHCSELKTFWRLWTHKIAVSISTTLFVLEKTKLKTVATMKTHDWYTIKKEMQLKNTNLELTKNKSFDTKCLQAKLSHQGVIFGARFSTSVSIFYEDFKILNNSVYLNIWPFI